ncbi:MAG: glycoside hydrolase family 31 protein [Polyangiaceae bacterium]
MLMSSVSNIGLASRTAVALALSALSAPGCGDDSNTGGAGGNGGGGAGGAPSCELQRRAEDDASTPPLHTPRWAFHPWISKDISTGEDSRAFVQGFMDRDIPVGVLVLDSPWETQYNTFEPNPDRYPEFATMVSDFRAVGVRTVVWVTQMINVSSYDLEPSGDAYYGPSPDWEPGKQCGYFVDDARQFGWWKGQGCALDFFNPDAVVFWHRLQDRVLDLGISGFKLDFGDSYIDEDPIRTAAGDKTLEEYSHAYYEDFYRYGVARFGPEEFVTMVRPYDKSYQFEGRFFARPEQAPVGWVGDNRRDYIGMQDALDHIMRSAVAGYVVLGSDIGGYLDRDDKDLTALVPLDSEVFMRWTAMGAMMPFMQLHGRANLEPWSLPDQTDLVLSTYRFWAKLHDAMVPFFDSVARRAQAKTPGAAPMIEPVAAEAGWPGDYSYVLGDAFLVAPVVDDTGVRSVAFPAGTRYFDFFDPAATPIDGGTVLASVDTSDPSRIPVFIREGAIVPLEVVDDTNGLGTSASSGALTVLAYPAPVSSSFEVWGEDGQVELTVSAIDGAAGPSIDLGDRARTVLLRVRVDAAPSGVDLDGQALSAHATRADFDAAATGYFVEGSFVWVKVAAGAATVVDIATP